MQWQPIDKTGSLTAKGIAILMIVAHNFMHVFSRPKQNEFSFKRENFDDFLYFLWHEPENIFRLVFSYFGHFGVQIFIFLSAYGLTKKYWHIEIRYRNFISDRFIRIYPTFLMALLMWFVLRYFWNSLNGTLETADFMLDAVFLKITLLSNFIPSYALKPVGPWWFLPFIFQFYFVYPFLLKAIRRFGDRVLFVISIICMMVTIVETGELNFFYTIIPHIPSFCLGIFLAKNDHCKIKISNYLILSIFFIFILGNLYQAFWFVSHFCSTILLILLFQGVFKTLKKSKLLLNGFLFLGSISMQLFFSHGFLRTPLADWAILYDQWFYVNILCLAFIVISICVAYLMYKLECCFRKFVTHW